MKTPCFLLFLATASLAQSATEIRVPLDQPAQVSAAIYDAEGRMVRELARARPFPAGPAALSWDGLDAAGRPAPAGDYQWRTLVSGGLQGEFLMSVGTSLGEPLWIGNHTGPGAVAVAEDRIVAAAMTEGAPEIGCITFDSRPVWLEGPFEAARKPQDIAIAGGKVYYLQNNSKIHVLDFATGRPEGKPVEVSIPAATFSLENLDGGSAEPQSVEFDVPNGRYFLLFTYGDETNAASAVEVNPNGMAPSPAHRNIPDKYSWWLIPAAKPGVTRTVFLPQLYGNPREVIVADGKLRLRFAPEKKGWGGFWKPGQVEILALPDRIAVREGELFLSSQSGGVVARIDLSNGKPLQTWKIPGVRDIGFSPEGKLYALTADGVVAPAEDSGKLTAVVKNLADPVCFAVDGQTGDLLVVDGGERCQVKRFGADGRLISVAGREEGRRTGAYDPADFLGVAAIAPDGHGGFVIAEQNTAPRRIARFDRENRLVQEWFGGMGFYSSVSLDPSDPGIGWMTGVGRGWIMQVRLDYESRTWKPAAIYRWPDHLETDYHDLPYNPPTLPTPFRFRPLHRDLDGDGKLETLLWVEGWPALIFVVEPEKGTLRPLAAMSRVKTEFYKDETLTVDQLPKAWVEAIRLASGDPADAKSRVQYARYAWADENADGIVQAGELQLADGKKNRGFPGLLVDPDLTVWQGGGFHAEKDGIFRKFAPVRYTACGAPVWNLAAPEIGPKPKSPSVSSTESLMRAPGGGLYALMTGGGDRMAPKSVYDSLTHGWGWPATTTDGCGILRFDDKWKTVWETHPKAARWPHPRGQLMVPRNFNGIARGYIAIGDQTANPCEFWTADGLYIGGLFDGRDPWNGSLPGGKPDRRYTWRSVGEKQLGQRRNYGASSLFASDDMLTGGVVAELKDGAVVFIGDGRNNNPCYRITGFDKIQRAEGSITLKEPVSQAAAGAGTGLLAEIFSSPDLSGEPVVREPAAQVWFDAQDKIRLWPEGSPKEGFSARFSGWLEPRFTEDYCLSVYARGNFRLWVDGKEVEWTKPDYGRNGNVKKGHSIPLPLQAGKRVPIRLEYRPASKAVSASLHLNWESLSQPVEHIPASALSPEKN